MRPLTDRQRYALLALAGHGILSRHAVGSMGSLIDRGYASKRRSWENNGNGRVVYAITDAGRQLAEEILADRRSR